MVVVHRNEKKIIGNMAIMDNVWNVGLTMYKLQSEKEKRPKRKEKTPNLPNSPLLKVKTFFFVLQINF